MEWIYKNKRLLWLLGVVIIFIAGLLDIKYEGLFFQLLPHSFQSFLADIFK